MDISKTFSEKPVQWGLRGDPHLWDALEAWFLSHEPPSSAQAFSEMLECAFEEITGKQLWTGESIIYIEAFNTGGMSGGYISLEFWRETGIPLLVGNYQGKNPLEESDHPRVVLFLVDGMRPDGLLQADTPTMDSIMQAGSFTLQAQTTFPSVTLSCHASLFLSVPPERHGILTNTWVPLARPVPGLFDVLHQVGKTAAAFYNWEELRDLSSPGSLAISLMLRNLESPIDQADWELTQAALTWLTTHDFDFAFIYLGKTDVVGHDHGWMSEPYLKAIQEADRCIGRVIQALPKITSYMVMADHGGHQRFHGTQEAEDMTIPVLAQGAGIAVGYELDGDFSIMDVAPSIHGALGLTRPKEWVGKPRLLNDHG